LRGVSVSRNAGKQRHGGGCDPDALSHSPSPFCAARAPAGFSIIGAAQIRCMRILCLIRVEIDAVGTAVDIV
jgi:hypothetical protein